MTNYFGTAETLTQLTPLTAGSINLMYENGNLRYIKVGQTEVLRMIYTAVRNKNWDTATSTISDEKIESNANSFKVEYKALYSLDEVQYEAAVAITGSADSSITFSMKGKALSNFLRNRIGICVLHPLTPCMGKKCVIQHTNGASESLVFPTLIKPHQPFKDIVAMHWQAHEFIDVSLAFEGDIFETEDQRNWSDASFKTYSTPADIPIPQPVNIGDTIEQQVTLSITTTGKLEYHVEEPVSIHVGKEKFSLPKIGYSKVAANLSAKDLELLQQIPFDHLRHEIHFEGDWQAQLNNAAREAEALKAKLELVVLFDATDDELPLLQQALMLIANLVYSVLVLGKNEKSTTSETIQKAYGILKEVLPGATIGVGTNRFFTEWNREPLTQDVFDFVSFSINPQVHAVDIRTIIENLEAQQYALATANHINSGKRLHISPVTLKTRIDGKHQHDARQYAAFTAAFTLLTLRNLANTAAITFYETKGDNGLISETVSTTYNYLQKIKSFTPQYILHTVSTNPLIAEALVLENAKGERLSFLVNFQPEKIKVDFNQQTITLPPASITEVHH